MLAQDETQGFRTDWFTEVGSQTSLFIIMNMSLTLAVGLLIQVSGMIGSVTATIQVRRNLEWAICASRHLGRAKWFLGRMR